jgi:hypothetical protein
MLLRNVGNLLPGYTASHLHKQQLFQEIPKYQHVEWLVVRRQEFLIEVSLKVTIFWDVVPCTPLERYQCFGITYRLHHQGRRLNRKGKRGERGKEMGLRVDQRMWAPCCACVTFKNNHMEKGVAYEIIVF